MSNRALETAATGSCFWRHAWSKWEQYEVKGKRLMDNGELHECVFHKQRRICLHCNKMEVEHVAG